MLTLRFHVSPNAPARLPLFLSAVTVPGAEQPTLGLVGDIVRLAN